ncbi:hypothetical protein HDU87_007815 [Geranomyces variabilis]|uniref:Uncharacterized protein n=1 Tax=Geranomyces variabilis TaxID=109894 RepID=A0AAD5XN21_9FUNG|nr:hypothetical protein HDU87_007815 [Geranomyces variabilis]
MFEEALFAAIAKQFSPGIRELPATPMSQLRRLVEETFYPVKNKNYSGLQRLGNIDETFVMPASSPPSGPESIAIDEPWRWFGFSADEEREPIEADIDDERLAELADVPPETGTHEPLMLVAATWP